MVAASGPLVARTRTSTLTRGLFRPGAGSASTWVDYHVWLDMWIEVVAVTLLDDLDVVMHAGARHVGSRAASALRTCPLTSTLSASRFRGVG